jgi:hypothetical protein
MMKTLRTTAVFLTAVLSLCLLSHDSVSLSWGSSPEAGNVRQACVNACGANACCAQICDYQNCLTSQTVRPMKVKGEYVSVVDNSAWGQAMNACSSLQNNMAQCLASSQQNVPLGTATKYPRGGNSGNNGIRVVSGTYGKNCGAKYGNVTPQLANACNGRNSCPYTIETRLIGDPAKGCEKDYTAEWRCPNTGWRTFKTSASPEAGNGKTITLSCQ